MGVREAGADERSQFAETGAVQDEEGNGWFVKMPARVSESLLAGQEVLSSSPEKLFAE